MPRTRGGVSGLLLVLLGAWGGLVPFIGPYFHFAYAPDKVWVYTSGRLWLSVLPGAAAVLGGLVTMVSAVRATAVLGAMLAAAGGAWFVVGYTVVGLLGGTADIGPGAPAGATTRMHLLEQLGFFSALGVVIVFFAAIAAGRSTVIGVRDAAMAERDLGLPDAATGPYPVGDPFAPAGQEVAGQDPVRQDLRPEGPGDAPPGGGDYPTASGGGDYPTASGGYRS